MLPFYDEELSPPLVELDAELFGPLDRDNAASVESYKMGTASFLFGNANPPILILQGDVDKLVYPAVSERFHEDCQKAKVPFHAFLQYTQGQHGFDALPFTPGGVLKATAVFDWIHRVLQFPHVADE